MEYRAYLIGRNGNIVLRVDLFCDDDEAAKVTALEREIAEQLGVSRSPVRDALMMLVNEGVVEVNIAKQRNGPTGQVKLAFIKAETRFENYSSRAQ